MGTIWERSRIRRAVGAISFVAIVALSACAVEPPFNPDSGSPGGFGDNQFVDADDLIRINELQYIGSHNSYHQAPDPEILQWLQLGASIIPEVKEALGDPQQLNYHHPSLTEQLERGLRTFELDVFADPTGRTFTDPAVPQMLGLDIAPPVGVDEPGFKVLHIQDIDYRSSCPTLRACIEELIEFSDEHPNHVPIIINIEMKEGALPVPFDFTTIAPFDAATIDALDDELKSLLGDRLITPDDVRGDHPNLRTAIETNGWPTLGESRGKFLFFLDNAGKRAAYLEGAPNLEGRVMFTSSGYGNGDGVLLKENDPGNGDLIAGLVASGHIVRTRADANVVQPSITQRDAALSSGAQIVHSDFPTGQHHRATGYTVTFSTEGVSGGQDLSVRCNPISATHHCQRAALQE